MIRRLILFCAVAALLPGYAAAQASMFGTRVLGLPLLPLSARAQGMGGGNALFDPEVGLNPAALWITQRHIGSVSLRHFWRSSDNPFGSASGNDTQFPLIMVAGPVGARWDYGVSVSGFTDRTFALALTDTLLLRDVPVAVNDTLVSRGGVTDIRGALAYTVSPRLAVGLGLHLLTGTNKIEYRRRFSDSSYVPVRIRNELSFSGPGLSAGVSAQPVNGLRLAGMVRWDGDLAYYKDSTQLESIPLPITLAVGFQVQAGSRLLLAGQGLRRNWSVTNEFVTSEGGLGSRNTTEASLGFEWIRNRARPNRFPLRAGIRYAQLPFPLVEAQKGREIQVSLGTGFRFTADRGSLDIALERAWRDDGGPFKERSFMISIGVGIRP
ncbi:MAG TPA: hypothetical protein VGA78_09080 [Gemmatimonadales bacterium]